MKKEVEVDFKYYEDGELVETNTLSDKSIAVVTPEGLSFAGEESLEVLKYLIESFIQGMGVYIHKEYGIPYNKYMEFINAITTICVGEVILSEDNENEADDRDEIYKKVDRMVQDKIKNVKDLDAQKALQLAQETLDELGINGQAMVIDMGAYMKSKQEQDSED